MNNLFVYLELQEESRVAEVSLELLTKGRSLATQLGCRLEAVAAGCNLEGIAAQVMPYGVDVLHLFDAEGLYPYTSLPHTSVLVNLFKEEQPQIALSVAPRTVKTPPCPLRRDVGIGIFFTPDRY